MTRVEESFWRERWENKQIGFHEGKPNEQLAACWSGLDLAKGSRVLVPLAGKARDLEWLAEEGHQVVGVELVLDAIRGYFEDRDLDLTAAKTSLGGRDAYVADRVTLVHADMLTVTPEELGAFDAIYDRAALVALEPSTRARYVAACRALLRASAPTLLISFSYDADLSGPPWSIDEAEVRELFSGRDVTVLDRRRGLSSARLTAAGVPSVEETAYRVGT